MYRNFDHLRHQTFDITIVGGGILGAFLALGAATRGLRTALVEKDDFGSGTTSGSGKVMHGGIRYLQNLHLGLAMEARREQAALARDGADLVRPLPFLVTPAGNGRTEKLLLQVGARVWDAFRRLSDRGVDLPPSRYLDEVELGRFFPTLTSKIKGALLFHDLQLRSPERFVFELLREASHRGATVVNYTEAIDLLLEGNRVRGLRLRDRMKSSELELLSPVVVNAAGAWSPTLFMNRLPHASDLPYVGFGKGIHAVVDRPEPPVALALPYRENDLREAAGTGQRRVFLMPWEGRTLVGASYSPFGESPDEVRPSAQEVQRFLHDIDTQWPGLGLADSRVLYAYAGLYPVFGPRRYTTKRFAASTRPLVMNHGRCGGPQGLVTAVSVKFTTARALAERVLAEASTVNVSRRVGARRYADHLTRSSEGAHLCSSSVARDNLGDRSRLPHLAARAATVEMARNLADVLFRRTWVGHLGHPGSGTLSAAAQAMAPILGWSKDEQVRQVREIDRIYRSMGAMTPASPTVEAGSRGAVDDKSREIKHDARR